MSLLPDEPRTTADALHAMVVELAAMAQNGLVYATDRYDLARYNRLQGLTAELLALIGQVDPDEAREALAAEAGHATPKVDVRGALFDARDRVLLVQEARDGRWTLPGGWADALDAPTAACEREFAEEAGLSVRVRRLAAVHDGSLRNAHAGSPWHVYKLLFLVEQTDPTQHPVAGLDEETTDVGYFLIDDLPPLSDRRTSRAQLEVLLAHHRDPALPADVD